VALGIRMLEQELAKRPWLASNQYSLADINGFNLAYALPLSQPALSNDELTPNTLRWLRAIYARPATKACWAMGRTSMVKRVTILEQPHIGPRQVT
jgi:glutathione S-transferase/GST-like protein